MSVDLDEIIIVLQFLTWKFVSNHKFVTLRTSAKDAYISEHYFQEMNPHVFVYWSFC